MIRILFSIIIAASIAAIAAGFLGVVHPAFDTLAHFRLHLSTGLLVLGLLVGWMAARRTALLAIVAAIGGIASCWQGLPYFGEPTVPPGKARSALHFNLRYNNKQPELFFSLVERTRPDILLLNEFSQAWEARLPALDADYPNRYHCPEWSAVGGVVIYSKFPIDAEPRHCHFYAALGLVRMRIDGVAVEIGSVHLRWPWPASGPRQVETLKPVLGRLGANVLIAGDFNATTWSHLISRFADFGNLNVAGGIGPTWIYQTVPPSLAAWTGFSIDNVMSKGAVRIKSARTMPPAGSDHLPVLVEFVIEANDCCTAD